MSHGYRALTENGLVRPLIVGFLPRRSGCAGRRFGSFEHGLSRPLGPNGNRALERARNFAIEIAAEGGTAAVVDEVEWLVSR